VRRYRKVNITLNNEIAKDKGMQINKTLYIAEEAARTEPLRVSKQNVDICFALDKVVSSLDESFNPEGEKDPEV